MNKQFNFAFFDFDGVIVDSELARINTYKDLFREVFEIDIEVSKNMIGHPESWNLKNLLELYKIDFDFKVLEELKKVRSKWLVKEAEKGFNGVNSVLQVITGLESKKIPMAIVTNSSYKYISCAFKNLSFDLSGFSITTAEDVLSSKPSPEIYLKALEWSGGQKIYVPRFGLSDGMIKYMYKSFNSRS